MKGEEWRGEIYLKNENMHVGEVREKKEGELWKLGRMLRSKRMYRWKERKKKWKSVRIGKVPEGANLVGKQSNCERKKREVKWTGKGRKEKLNIGVREMLHAWEAKKWKLSKKKYVKEEYIKDEEKA
jgi:hypothetical protein